MDGEIKPRQEGDFQMYTNPLYKPEGENQDPLKGLTSKQPSEPSQKMFTRSKSEPKSVLARMQSGKISRSMSNLLGKTVVVGVSKAMSALYDRTKPVQLFYTDADPEEWLPFK